MAPFQYEPFVNPYGASVGALLAHSNDAAARATEIAGNAWGRAAESIGQIPQQIADAKDKAAITALRQSEVDQNALRTQQMRHASQGQQVLVSLLPQFKKTDPETGETRIDHEGLAGAVESAGFPDTASDWLKKSADNSENAEKLRAAQQSRRQAVLTSVGGAASKAASPDDFLDRLKMLYHDGDGAIDTPTYQTIVQNVQQAGSDGFAAVKQKYVDFANQYGKKTALPRESPGVLNEATGEIAPVPLPSSAQPEASVVFKDDKGIEHPVVFDKSTKKYLFNGQDVTSQVTRPEAKDSGAQQTDRYLKILTAKKLGEPIAPEDSAWAQSYEHNKLMGPEAASAAAALRQANTIAEQNALQRRSQEFQEAQAGRSELTTKIEQPYLDAREKADTLRSVISAAQHGNMEAAAVQKLMATLGVVTMEGVKRINTAEMDQVGGAGSLLTEIKSKVGKVVAGQPLPADLQKDLGELSTLLEKGARHKYEQGFQQVTKRYGLKDEQLIPTPDTSTPSAPLTPGLQGLKDRK